MRFFALSAVICAIAEAGLVQNDLVTGYLKNIQALVKSSQPATPFLTESSAIRELLVNGKAESQSKEMNGLLRAVRESKAKIETFIVTQVASKVNEESKKEINVLLDNLSKTDNLERSVKDRIETTFLEHPEYPEIIRSTVATMPEPVREQMLDYAKHFFGVANESHPEVADAIVDVLEWSQEEFELFPEDFYAKLRDIFNKTP